MGNKRYTAEDIAAEAGVSLMTVSRVFNGHKAVAKATREKILAIAERMGYRPSRIARGLASRRTSNVGIILPDMANPFFAILAKAATDVARAADLNVFIINTDDDTALELAAYESLIEERIDGVIVAASRLPAERLRVAMANFQAPVLINSDVNAPEIGHVDVDDRAGIVAAMAYLHASGRRRIGFVAGPEESGSARRRLAGYIEGVAATGGRLDPRCVERSTTPGIEEGARAAEALVSRIPDLDAIVAHNDITAIGVLRGLATAGRAVPRDVAVIGVDDVPYAALVHPSLSTLHVDISALGRQAMECLLALRSGLALERLPPIKPEMVLRESTSPCP